jgi:hypothetical protein
VAASALSAHDGAEIRLQTVEDFLAVLQASDPGDKLEVTVGPCTGEEPSPFASAIGRARGPRP